VVGARDAVPSEPGGLLESPALADAALPGTRTSWSDRVHWGDFESIRIVRADDACRR
jgi:hypothetical protein